MTEVDDVKRIVALLRQRAEVTDDVERQRKLRQLADKWDGTSEKPSAAVMKVLGEQGWDPGMGRTRSAPASDKRSAIRRSRRT